MKSVRLIGCLIILNLIYGCSYYEVYQSHYNSFADVDIFTDSDRFYIVHFNDNTWNIRNITILNDTIHGRILGIPMNHRLYKSTDTNGLNRYRQNRDKALFDELHFYTSHLSSNQSDSVKIPLASIQYLEWYEKDSETTFTIIGASILVLIITLVISV